MIDRCHRDRIEKDHLMSRFHAWVLALAGLLCVEGAARAQLVYEFANATTGVAQTSFTVAPGATVPIRVYIRDTAAGAPTLNSNGGLGSAAVRVTYGNGTVAAVQSLTDASGPVPPWDLTTTTFGVAPQNPVPSVAVADGKFIGTGITPASFGETQRVLVGTFIFRGLTAGSVNLTAIEPNSASSGDTVSFNIPPVSYDAILANNPGAATLIVGTPIPEPGTFALVGVGMAGLVAYRRRRAVKS
jgi:hypothetical protein